MKMIIIIVQDNDADTLTRAFTAENFRVTRVASTGGFMRSGVVTMLLGVEDPQVDAAIKVVRDALPSSGEKKRATLFVVPVQHFEQV
ncbi:MAG: cyclic-di-AMP receptor [Anaerolineales bacterium]|uniref:cyclic-di-AMP receptor n=1 Tax=Candidatus Villigracilis proximus TaxID=3140683 RepID=UPI003136B482|nr:cyclic-di-AMP receptor [Anaerolineales bacterium]MBK8824209.1 cyclic-di-AMP receptor [Anaerolineales bacterium]MBK9210206.1 cyclic-di-AMP receptor [Anaerolineales bacterium]